MKIIILTFLAFTFVGACRETVATSVDGEQAEAELPPYNRAKRVSQRFSDRKTFRDDRPDIRYKLDRRDTIDLSRLDDCGRAFFEAVAPIYCVRNGGEFDYIICGLDLPQIEIYSDYWPVEQIHQYNVDSVWYKYLSHHRPADVTCELSAADVRAMLGPPPLTSVAWSDEILNYFYYIAADYRVGPCPIERNHAGYAVNNWYAYEFCGLLLRMHFDVSSSDSLITNVVLN